ncbi:MAG: hypothetical protein IMZ62_03270 [Chloroflexi bacterium]|nr:hypothetical protein [Chloroflexota bacterium]
MINQKKQARQFVFIEYLQDTLAKVITETRDHLDGGLANAGKRTGNRDAARLRLDDYLSRPVLETGLPQMRALLPDKGNFS